MSDTTVVPDYEAEVRDAYPYAWSTGEGWVAVNEMRYRGPNPWEAAWFVLLAPKRLNAARGTVRATHPHAYVSGDNGFIYSDAKEIGGEFLGHDWFEAARCVEDIQTVKERYPFARDCGHGHIFSVGAGLDYKFLGLSWSQAAEYVRREAE